ncbi:MAG: hypothetical protein ABSA70_09605 [Terriglobia bacterium]
MNRKLAVAALLVLCASLGAAGEERRSRPQPALRAPGYYIAVRASLVDDQLVALFGASNLPPGSILWVVLTDFTGAGPKTVNGETNATVGKDGLFRVEIHPKMGEVFRHKIVCDVIFAPTDPAQPPNVIKVVGKTGGRLGDWRKNPQVDGNERVSRLVTTTIVP